MTIRYLFVIRVLMMILFNSCLHVVARSTGSLEILSFVFVNENKVTRIKMQISLNQRITIQIIYNLLKKAYSYVINVMAIFLNIPRKRQYISSLLMFHFTDQRVPLLASMAMTFLIFISCLIFSRLFIINDRLCGVSVQI